MPGQPWGQRSIVWTIVPTPTKNINLKARVATTIISTFLKNIDLEHFRITCQSSSTLASIFVLWALLKCCFHFDKNPSALPRRTQHGNTSHRGLRMGWCAKKAFPKDILLAYKKFVTTCLAHNPRKDQKNKYQECFWSTHVFTSQVKTTPDVWQTLIFLFTYPTNCL